MLAYSGFYRPKESFTFVSETGSPTTGFSAANIITTRQGAYWLVPSGGPHTATLQFTTTRADLFALFITSPAGRPVIGDLTVNFTVGYGTTNTPYGPYTLPKYVSDRYRDQRILIPEFVETSQTHRVAITAATGSCISRVGLLYADSTYRDITRYGGGSSLTASPLSVFDQGWQASSVDIVRAGENARGGNFHTSNFSAAPVRARILSGVAPMNQLSSAILVGPQSATLRFSGIRGEIVVLMNAALYSSSTAQKKLMHKQSLFGRRTNNLVFAKETLSGYYSHTLQFKELI